MKVGIFIVAYNAEKTISNVIDRISDAAWGKIDEVFVFDDRSKDNTSDAISRYKGANTEKIRVFRNNHNLGYGGNQKRGYLYAIENGFDIVVLLHGDGQYAPEMIEEMISPLESELTAAVFGSRMLEKGAALSGGMPLYKLVGNKILTWIQNQLLVSELSEFHSGYRAYRVQALKELPFLKNSNDFHFDTQIIIQLMDNNSKIVEIPIPVYYGDEICHVNGLQYAFNVVISTFKYRLHKLGIVTANEYVFENQEVHYSFKKNKHSSHQQIIDLVNKQGSATRVFDVGCGQGLLSAQFTRSGHIVTSVDLNHVEPIEGVFSQCHQANLDNANEFDTQALSRYDTIVYADILEHLREPQDLIINLDQYLNSGGRIIASTGNVAHLFIRLMLLLGIFKYTDKGILDSTHTKLFTKKTFIELFDNCGYKVVGKAVTPIPFENIFSNTKIVNTMSSINMFFAKLMPGLFAYQFVYVFEKNVKKTGDLLRERQIYAPYVDEQA